MIPSNFETFVSHITNNKKAKNTNPSMLTAIVNYIHAIPFHFEFDLPCFYFQINNDHLIYHAFQKMPTKNTLMVNE